MSNAKVEFLEHVGERSVKCADIKWGDGYYDEHPKLYLLPVGYSELQWDEFLSQLDFSYHDGYGSQELFGHIWYQDGTWSERGEYDGSEWWEHKVCPPIPESLVAAPTPPGEGARTMGQGREGKGEQL